MVFRIKLLGGALATSSKCYFRALLDKNVFLFGLSSEGGFICHALKIHAYQ